MSLPSPDNSGGHGHVEAVILHLAWANTLCGRVRYVLEELQRLALRKQVWQSENQSGFITVLTCLSTEYIGLTNQRLPTNSSGKWGISHHALSPDHELSVVRRAVQ